MERRLAMAKDWVGGSAAVFKTLGASNHTDADRQREDYYATEPKATEWLCKLERFEGRAVYAYAQPYRDPSNPNHVIPEWQKDMARWCNKRMIFCTTDFKDFMPRKGFRCEEYMREYELL